MRPPLRLLLVLLAAAFAGGLAGCSDAWIASRDDQHIPAVPPAQWEGNPLNMPSPSQGARQ